MFIAIIDEEFVMPDVDHHDDATLSSFNKPNERNVIGI